jgi:hypothetical protein
MSDMFDGCGMLPPLFCPFRAAATVESRPRAALRGYRRYALPWAGLLRPFRPKTAELNSQIHFAGKN